MVPVYLAQLGLITQMGDTTVKLLKTTSFAIMIAALMIGAFIILRSFIQGRREEKLRHAADVLEHGNI
jgi:hypothetical protein